LVLTLLQHLATSVPFEAATDELEGEAAGTVSQPLNDATVRVPDLILAIEEPELYLHPARCRYLADLLLTLAEPQGEERTRTQIIYTTHSPYFVDLDRFDQIRMVRKVPSRDSATLCSRVTSFLLDDAAKQVAAVCEIDPSKCTRESFRARATSVMSTVVNEGFFADVVVVVEGPSDVGTLWKLQDIMGKGWLQLGISVIPAGGKNNIDRPTIVFRGFDIPTYFVFDADSHLRGGPQEKEAKQRNRRYLRLAGAPVEDFPRTQVHETWAVFGGNLESELQSALGGEELHAIRREVASELGYDDPDHVNKNIEGSARLVELLYEKGKSLPVLEQIVEAVTKLRQ